MTTIKNLSSVVIGLAMFSMFFGSGNLIFPIYVGQIVNDHWIMAFLGFFCTAIALPFLGVLVMAMYRGDYHKVFSTLGEKPGFFLTCLLLTTWIPLGSGPRCVSLAYFTLDLQTTIAPPLWVFSLLYCLLTIFIVYKKNQMLEVLGKFLTPALLGCLALIVIQGIQTPSVTVPSPDKLNQATTHSFLTGLLEGYNTMDLIASFFFSAAVIDILMRADLGERASIFKTFRAGLLGMSLLAVVYFCMMWLGATFYSELVNVPKVQLLAHISHTTLGNSLGFVSSIIVVLACITTSTALLVVYADFLADFIFKDRNKEWIGIIITQVSCFLMSLLGLKGITSITHPIFEVCYPLLTILILINIGKKLLTKKSLSLDTTP